jgi:hypothetical protein
MPLYPHACNPSRRAYDAAASNPSRAVRRRKPSCPPPICRREGRREHRKEIRDSSVIFVRVRVHRVAGSASPEHCRHASSPAAALRCPCHPWRPPLCSPFACRRLGAGPVAIGAPLRVFAVAPASRRLAPPLLPRRRRLPPRRWPRVRDRGRRILDPRPGSV